MRSMARAAVKSAVATCAGVAVLLVMGFCLMQSLLTRPPRTHSQPSPVRLDGEHAHSSPQARLSLRRELLKQ
jgi:hypothetical protein